MSGFIRQQRLDYPDHKSEIAHLNKILAEIQAVQPFPPELEPTVRDILIRLDELIMHKAVLKDYDPGEQYL